MHLESNNYLRPTLLRFDNHAPPIFIFIFCSEQHDFLGEERGGREKPLGGAFPWAALKHAPRLCAQGGEAHREPHRRLSCPPNSGGGAHLLTRAQ